MKEWPDPNDDTGSDLLIHIEFWGLLALIIAGLTVLKWNRGEWYKIGYFSGKKNAESIASHTDGNVNKSPKENLSRVFLPAVLVALLAFGFFIHANIPESNDYQAMNKSLDDQALYERKYKQYQKYYLPEKKNDQT